MGGVNPYIKPAEATLPIKKYRVTFLPDGKVLEVEPDQLPYGRNGLAGSIFDLAHAAGVKLDHSCGGVCACSTCHVIVKQGLETCNEATDDELDMLDEARGVTTESRLGCPGVPDGARGVGGGVPGWER